MNKKEIRDSGLLELHAIGALSEEEALQVEGYLTEFPDLKKDFYEIQVSLQSLAAEYAVSPRVGLENDIIDYVKKNNTSGFSGSSNSDSTPNEPNKPNGNGGWKLLSLLFFLSTAAAGYFFWDSNEKLQALSEEYNQYQEECDSTALVQQQSLDLYEQLNRRENKVLNMTPTAGYPETQLLFHINSVQQQNYIQIQNLPGIAANQAFQLWSLKPGVDPIPLTVFKQGNSFIVPVDFEEGTGTYAITIEDEAGAQTPTLERLIGTVTV